MYVEKKGSVMIHPAPGSSISRAVALACDKIVNARIVRVDLAKEYKDRYGLSGLSQTVIAEDLDIPGHNHRITVYKDNVAKFGPLFVEGAVIEAQGLRTTNFGFNALDVTVIKAAPAAVVAASVAETAPQAAEETAA